METATLQDQDPMTRAAGPIRPPAQLLPEGARATLVFTKASVRKSTNNNDMFEFELGPKEGASYTDSEGNPILPSYKLFDRVVLYDTPENNARKLRRVICSVEKVRKGEVPPYAPADLLANPERVLGKDADITTSIEIDANGHYDPKNKVRNWWLI